MTAGLVIGAFAGVAILLAAVGLTYLLTSWLLGDRKRDR